MRAGVGAMEAADGEEAKGLVASEREDMAEGGEEVGAAAQGEGPRAARVGGAGGGREGRGEGSAG
jgi:hypothetical protein